MLLDFRPLVHPSASFPCRRTIAQSTERPDGAYEPYNFMKAAHMKPEEAVKAFDDLEAKYGIAIHWETFKLTTEPKQELPEC